MSNPNNILPFSGTVTIGQYYHFGAPVKTGVQDVISYARNNVLVTGSSQITTGNFLSGVFFWEPSVGMQLQSEPKVTSVSFGDGYNQRFDDGINNQLMTLELKFEQRSDTEAYGIEHFLREYGGVTAFSYTPPPPYDRVTGKMWICSKWSCQKNFKNNNSLSATFDQVVI